MKNQEVQNNDGTESNMIEHWKAKVKVQIINISNNINPNKIYFPPVNVPLI